MSIYLNNVVKKYEPSFELKIRNLNFDEGKIYGIVGNNGVGKTTLLKSVLDLIKLDEGDVFINNIQVNKYDGWKKITSAYLNQSFLIDYLTPFEYFELIGHFYELKGEKLINRLNKYSDFLSNELIKKNVKIIRELSDGNKQKVGIVGALINEAKYIILDEPHSNLDPKSQIMLKQLLLELNKNNGSTIIISSHNLNFISEICNRVILLEDGKIIKDERVSDTTLNELREYFENQIKE